jgi:hypothetical protein
VGSRSSSIELGEFADWINELKNIESTLKQIERYPGVKLIEFFEELGDTKRMQLSFATKQTVQRSRTMAKLHAVDKGLIELWLARWGLS